MEEIKTNQHDVREAHRGTKMREKKRGAMLLAPLPNTPQVYISHDDEDPERTENDDDTKSSEQLTLQYSAFSSGSPRAVEKDLELSGPSQSFAAMLKPLCQLGNSHAYSVSKCFFFGRRRIWLGSECIQKYFLLRRKNAPLG